MRSKEDFRVGQEIIWHRAWNPSGGISIPEGKILELREDHVLVRDEEEDGSEEVKYSAIR